MSPTRASVLSGRDSALSEIPFERLRRPWRARPRSGRRRSARFGSSFHGRSGPDSVFCPSLRNTRGPNHHPVIRGPYAKLSDFQKSILGVRKLAQTQARTMRAPPPARPKVLRGALDFLIVQMPDKADFQSCDSAYLRTCACQIGGRSCPNAGRPDSSTAGKRTEHRKNTQYDHIKVARFARDRF